MNSSSTFQIDPLGVNRDIEDKASENDISTNDIGNDFMDITYAYCFPEEQDNFNLTEDMYHGLSKEFYKHMGLMAAKNHTRDNIRQITTVEKDSLNTPLYLERCQLEEKIQKSVKQETMKLKNRLKLEVRKEKRAHMHVVVACGEFLLTNGPLVKTQTLSKLLAASKLQYLNKPTESIKRKMSAEVVETLSRVLPIMQIYINKVGYIMEYRKGNIQSFVDSIDNSNNFQETANRNLHTALEDFKNYIYLADTQLDKAIVKAILIELYSVNAVSKLNGAKCKQTLERARDEIPNKIAKYKDMGKALLTVRNDMTSIQQHMLYKRTLAKANSFKARAIGAGREKMSDKFPQLAEVLEQAFGEGSKIHPRLTKETRFRSPDLALTMPQAREVLLSVCSDKLPNIALSTCYT